MSRALTAALAIAERAATDLSLDSAARAQAERCIADLQAAQRNATPKVRAAVEGWKSGETPFSIRYAAALRDALAGWS